MCSSDLAVPAPGEDLVETREDGLLREALVDDVPKALGPRLGREGQPSPAELLQALGQTDRETVHPQAGQAQLGVPLGQGDVQGVDDPKTAPFVSK